MWCFLSNKDGAKPFVKDMGAGKGKIRYLDISVRHRDTDSDIQPTGNRPETEHYTEMGDALGEVENSNSGSLLAKLLQGTCFDFFP